MRSHRSAYASPTERICAHIRVHLRPFSGRMCARTLEESGTLGVPDLPRRDRIPRGRLTTAPKARVAAGMLDGASRLASALSALRPDAAVKVHRLTPDGRSWLLHAPKFWPIQTEELESLWRERPVEATRGMIMGREVAFPRRTCAYGQDYKYTGQTQVAVQFEHAHPLVRTAAESMSAVNSLEGLNAALVNWYEASDGEYMGAHSDDERALVRQAPVVSLSWASQGHYRRFRFTTRKDCCDALLPSWGAAPGVLELRNGCLLVMGGECQRTHKHELMTPTKALGESAGRRINLTLRAFAVESPAASSTARKRSRDGDGVGLGPPPKPHPAISPEPPAPPPPRACSHAAGHVVVRSSYFLDDGLDEEALARACP